MAEEKKPEKLDSYDEDDIGIGRKLKTGRNSRKSNTLWISFLLIVVIIGSFWLSFSIGKRLINPVKKLPEMSIREELPSIVSPEVITVQYTPEVMNEDYSVPAEPTPIIPTPKPAEKTKKLQVVEQTEEVVEEIVPEVKPVSKKLYKVRTSIHSNRADAEALSTKFKNAGIECFIKEGTNGFFVQVGAYSKREGAESFVESLKSKGFDVKVVVE